MVILLIPKLFMKLSVERHLSLEYFLCSIINIPPFKKERELSQVRIPNKSQEENIAGPNENENENACAVLKLGVSSSPA